MGQTSVFTHVLDRPNHFGCVIGVPEVYLSCFNICRLIYTDLISKALSLHWARG